METIKQLNKDQYNLLSWFATYIYNVYILKDRQIDQYVYGKMQGIQSACSIIGIPDEMLYKIEIDRIFTCLRNWNKMSEVIIFD